LSPPAGPVVTPSGRLGSAAPVTGDFAAEKFVAATAATAVAAAAAAAAAAFALVVCCPPALASPAASPQEIVLPLATVSRSPLAAVLQSPPALASPIPLAVASPIPLATASPIPLPAVSAIPLPPASPVPLAASAAMSSSGVEWEVVVPSLVGVTPAGALIAVTATAGTLCLGFALFIAVGVLFQPRWIISWVRQNQPHILFEHVTKERLVALTIDDGPNGETTHDCWICSRTMGARPPSS
ncbi:hypothetical protein CLOP_g1355, partial [Closterium sp. NIES-67]